MDGDKLAESIRGAQRGDPGSFDQLVEMFASRVFGFLYRMTGSPTDAEDLVQEVFLRLVRMIGAYRHQDRFEAWLFRIAANLARDRSRRAARVPKGLTAASHRAGDQDDDARDQLDNLASPVEAADARMSRSEEADALAIALDKLPVAEREVIMLRHFSQLSFKEIADVTGTPLGTALARAHRGLAKLRELMTAPAGRTRDARSGLGKPGEV
jgi:RNA polymerase sigma-70 factor, ECF subfamily